MLCYMLSLCLDVPSAAEMSKGLQMPVQCHLLLNKRWRHIPWHLQRLFTHGFKQPREAQKTQRRPQSLTTNISLLSFSFHCSICKTMLVFNSQARSETFSLATSHFVQSSFSWCWLQKAEHYKQGILCVNTSVQNNCFHLKTVEQLYESSARCEESLWLGHNFRIKPD